MTCKIIYTNSYNKRAARFIIKHPELTNQYRKVLQLLELNPYHPSLRLHKLQGKLSELYCVSINMSCRISIDFIITEETIIPVNIGTHNQVY